MTNHGGRSSIMNILRKESIIAALPELKILQGTNELPNRCINAVDRCNLMLSYENAVNKVLDMATKRPKDFEGVVELLTSRSEELLTEMFYVTYDMDSNYIKKMMKSANTFDSRFNYYVRCMMSFSKLISRNQAYSKTLFGIPIREHLTAEDFLYCISLSHMLCCGNDEIPDEIENSLHKIHEVNTRELFDYEKTDSPYTKCISFAVMSTGSIKYLSDEILIYTNDDGSEYMISVEPNSTFYDDDEDCCFVSPNDITSNIEETVFISIVKWLMSSHPMLYKYRIYTAD